MSYREPRGLPEGHAALLGCVLFPQGVSQRAGLSPVSAPLVQRLAGGSRSLLFVIRPMARLPPHRSSQIHAPLFLQHPDR
jgi:hypothetical protein